MTRLIRRRRVASGAVWNVTRSERGPSRARSPFDRASSAIWNMSCAEGKGIVLRGDDPVAAGALRAVERSIGRIDEVLDRVVRTLGDGDPDRHAHAADPVPSQIQV